MNQKITICSVGDLMICDSPLYASVGVGSQYSKVRSEMFARCKELLHQADITIGNFETVVHQPKNKSLKEQQMCCPESVVQDLKNIGFSILNLANNHCMQHGTDGFHTTAKACESNDIQPVGILNEKPYRLTVNGIDLAFFSLCIHLEWYEPDNICYENQIDRIIRKICDLRQQDSQVVIVVSVHWGDEFAAYPSNTQIALAHKLIECGTDVILGHHSHVYQGIEEYQNGLIVYGQGNFVSDMIPKLCRQTGIVQISLEREDGKLKKSYQLFPYVINDRFCLIPAKEDWFQKRQELLKKAVGGSFSDDDYWNAIKVNHRQGHNAFKNYFKKNIGKYRLSVSVKMILEFLGRKFKRVVGTTTDGRVSSMDPIIMEAIKNADQPESK